MADSWSVTESDGSRGVCLQPARPSQFEGKRRAALKRLYLGNLPYRISESDVSDWFQQQGVHVDVVTLIRDKFSNEPRGFGFAEIAAADAMRDYASVNPDTIGFHKKDQVHQMLKIARINARTNLTNAKNLYTSMLSDERQLRYYAVKFSDAPVYFNSVAFLPEWDFDGQRLQDLRFIAEFKPISFSAWVANDRAVAVFCWHESADDICAPFVDSLRRSKSDRLADRILSMAFEFSENVVFRRDWWESISEPDRQRIVNRVLSGVGDIDRKRNCLADDGLLALTSAVENEYVHYHSCLK